MSAVYSIQSIAVAKAAVKNSRNGLFGQVIFGLFLAVSGMSHPAHGTMTVSGPILANAVNVSGSVTISSMTVSTLTVTNMLNVVGAAPTLTGSIVQMVFSSTTFTTSTTDTTFQPVAGTSTTITLSNTSDYVRVSLTGSTSATGINYAITIKRDSTNLGSGPENTGFLLMESPAGVTVPIEIITTDSPGDTKPHTYQAYIRSLNSGTTKFVDGGIGYLLLEEIRL